MRYVLLLLLVGCYGNATGPKAPVIIAGDHAGDRCWVINQKIPLPSPYQGDTLIVWGHISGCVSH